MALLQEARSRTRKSRPASSGPSGGEARPAEDRQRDRAEGAKAACEGCRYLEGCQVARAWDRHGAAHLKRAWVKGSTAVFFLSPGLSCVGTPGREGVRKSQIHPDPLPGNLVLKRFLAMRREKWAGLFLGYLLRKIIDGERIRCDHLYLRRSRHSQFTPANRTFCPWSSDS